jgi:hypothetical protein
MTSTDPIFEMAETLIVLAGANAWAAARAFGSEQAQVGKAETARQWRNVARAVLRKQAAAVGVPAETAFARTGAFDSVAPSLSVAPIPLRARRQLAMLATEHAAKPAEFDAFEFAKAA